MLNKTGMRGTLLKHRKNVIALTNLPLPQKASGYTQESAQPKAGCLTKKSRVVCHIRIAKV